MKYYYEIILSKYTYDYLHQLPSNKYKKGMWDSLSTYSTQYIFIIYYYFILALNLYGFKKIAWISYIEYDSKLNLPCNATGIASSWIFEGVFHFTDWHASHSTSIIP